MMSRCNRCTCLDLDTPIGVWSWGCRPSSNIWGMNTPSYGKGKQFPAHHSAIAEGPSDAACNRGMFAFADELLVWTLLYPGCWSRSENMHGFGGKPVVNIDSVAACQSACLSSSSCVAIDHDPANPRRQYCWLLTSTVTAPAPGVTHYALLTCSGIVCRIVSTADLC